MVHVVKIYEDFHSKARIQKKVISPNNFTYRHIIKAIEKYIGGRKNLHILDIGCGVGTVSFYFAQKGHTVLGVDISKKSVQQASLNAKYLKLKNISFRQLYFPSIYLKGKYDVVICCEVIEHLSNDILAIKRIYQLLKKKGWALITTPSKNAPLHRLRLTKEFDKKVGHLRRYSIEDLSEKLRKEKFKILEVQKHEGIFRNFLFINPFAGKLVRFLKWILSDIATFLDIISLILFGESNIFILVKKT